MKRKASAVWNGGLKDGKGAISTESGVLKDTQYSFSTRFENGTGTNPEELIAAAHAGCFTMALSAQLSGVNLRPERISTTATVTLDKLEGTLVWLEVFKPHAFTVPLVNSATSNCQPQAMALTPVTLVGTTVP